MIHARKDYDHIQDATGNIGDDEPVFLLRAKDRLAPDTLRAWALLLEESGGDKAIVDHVIQWAERMDQWQAANGCKLPDAPLDQLRDPNSPAM